MAINSMLNGEISDDALVHRLFDLAHHVAQGDTRPNHELAQVDALVYARFTAAYGESSNPQADGRIAA